jgi:2-keto-3-deoxy-L-rhamnonate aldolase RhmA
MTKRPNVRKSAIAKAIETGIPACGFHMSIASPAEIEILGGFPFDFVFLDGEHGNFSLSDLEDCCRAAELYDLTIVARVPGPDANVISQYLNAGVQGIVVPHVDTVADAKVAIESCRYAPAGIRPSGGGRSSGQWRGVADLTASLAEANANVTLSVQIESIEATQNLQGMLDLGGIDYFTIGKQDLAQSMGFARLPEGWPPEVMAANSHCIDLIRSRGGRLKDDVMTVGRVSRFLTDGAKRFLEKEGKTI